MRIQEYMEKNKVIQTRLLRYIVDEEFIEENFQNFIYFLNEQKFCDNRARFRIFLCIFSKKANNQHRSNFFFKKTQKKYCYLFRMKSKISLQIQIFK